MAVDLRIVTPNRPGALLEATETLAAAGIPLEGFCGDLRPGERWGYLHFLVADGDGGKKALEAAGFEVTSSHDVDVLDLDKHTGSLAEEVKRYSGEGRNIEVVYIATAGQIVIGTDDMQKERVGVRMEDAR